MLEVQGLTVYYGNARAVEEVSLEVHRGEFVSLIGANGAGKSTTIRAIMGLVPCRSGRILYQGEDLGQRPAWDRVTAGIGYVPEGRRVFAGLTVENNLRMGAYRMPEPALRRNLERVYALFPRLAERRSQLAGTMSGGEQQMLALGRALMCDPKLLIIDEVSMGLMPKAVQQAFAMLQQLHREGMTILLVEQNARKALALADRGYVLETGHLALSGSAADLRADPRVQAAYLGGGSVRRPQSKEEEPR